MPHREAEGAGGGPLPITASRMGCLQDALPRAYDVLGSGRAAAGEEVFRDLVLARMRGARGPGPGEPGPLRRARAVFGRYDYVTTAGMAGTGL